MQKIGKIITILMLLILASCSGTGTSNYTAVAPVIDNNPTNKVFIYRDSGYIGAGALITVILNGREIGKLGSGEFIVSETNQEKNYLEAKITGIQGLGLNIASDSFTKSNEGNFYLLKMQAGLLSNKIELIGTTQSSWRALAR